MSIDPNKPRRLRIDLSPGAKLVLPVIPKLADNPLISSHFNQLLAKNPAFSLDLNFLKKSIYEHEAEATEANNARLQSAFEYAKKMYADYLEAREELFATKDSVRIGVFRYMAANDVAYKASVQNREDRVRIIRMEKEIERLLKAKDDLISRKKGLSSDCARLKIENQLLESKLGAACHGWQLKVNELAQSKYELETTRTSLNQARMQLNNLGPNGTLVPFRSEGTTDDDDMEYLCNKLKEKNDRLNDLEDELFQMRGNYWKADKLYQYFRAAFVKMDELCLELHHEIDQVGLKVTAAGSTGDNVKRLNEEEVAEIQASIVSKFYPISPYMNRNPC
jgi:DNA repair exonuclease SbcCD ATPase subunit